MPEGVDEGSVLENNNSDSNNFSDDYGVGNDSTDEDIPSKPRRVMSSSTVATNNGNEHGRGEGPHMSVVGDGNEEGVGGRASDMMIMAQREDMDKRMILLNPEIVCAQTEPILSTLTKEFRDDIKFNMKIESLSRKYSCLRRVRPDGNCFFRCLAFAYAQRLIEPEMRQEWSRFKEVVGRSKSEMIDGLGFPKFTVEDFYDNFMLFLDKCHPAVLQDATETVSRPEDCMSYDELLELFNDQGQSDYIVVFLRLLVSKHIQMNGDFYTHFMENGVSVAEFCSTQVEPMYQESDHIHISALTEATGISVRIMYLDRGEQNEPSPHDFPSGKEPHVHLLYRPGHYDILYPIK